MLVQILDYETGNLESVRNAFLKLDCQVKIVKNIREIRKSNLLVLPGVGSFDFVMRLLQKQNMSNDISDLYGRNNIKVLGICLGMQILFQESEEGIEKGLGIFNGSIKLLQKSDTYEKIPVLGWRKIKEITSGGPLKTFDDSRFYFSHSYYAKLDSQDCVMMETSYGNLKIPAIVRRENFMGLQFHPEKSGTIGLKLLKNILETKTFVL